MPNWCSNDITIEGSLEEIKALSNLCSTKESAFDFNGLVPRPDACSDLCEWSIENWGTKWIFEDPNVILLLDEKIPRIHITADSAWSPPIEFFKRVVAKFPSLSVYIKYAEPGMYFAGETDINSSGCYDSEYSEEEAREYFIELGFEDDYENDYEDVKQEDKHPVAMLLK